MFLSVYEVASKFSARLLKKIIANPDEKQLAWIVIKRVRLGRKPNSKKRVSFLSKHHYLRTRKANETVYTAIPGRGVLILN